MSTISDVAAAAGVSVATVSRALRGLDRVSPSTRDRVLRVATELNYVASPMAASLASGRTRVVGVVTPSLDRWFFAALLDGIGKAIRAHRHHVLLFDLGTTANRRLELTGDMLGKRVDGLITVNLPLTTPERALLRRLDVPVVTVGTSYRGWPSVGIDDAATVEVALRHLVDQGHIDIAYSGATGPPSAFGPTPVERRNGFRSAMRQRGLAIRQSWIRGPDWTPADAARDSMHLLTLPHRPTAVLAASDEIALGVMAAAWRLGLRMPEDLSVIGIDDHPFAVAFDLTTVRQDVDAQARQAALILMQELGTTGSPGDNPRDGRTVFPTHLQVRRSTAPPPGGLRRKS